MTAEVGLGPLLEAVRRARNDHPGPGPLLVGISGAVGVGKSTVAATLARCLAEEGVTAEVVCTDGFLRPNEDLAAAGLKMRKGFPESFDDHLLADTLQRISDGAPGIQVPEYSHVVYDRIPGTGRAIGAVDVVIVEGVNALQATVAPHLHVGVYVEADEDVLREWFTARFLALCAAADAEPDGNSFYRMFLKHDEAERRAIAARTWNEVNGVNLRDHIGPSRNAATYVVHKDADHSIRTVIAAT
jgi:type I pantothenate kinase